MIFIGHVKSHYVDLPVFLELIPCCWSVYLIFILTFIMTQQVFIMPLKTLKLLKMIAILWVELFLELFIH